MLVRRFLAGICAALVAAAAAATPTLPASSSADTAAIADDFDRLLAFICASPLDASERRRIAEETAERMRTDPAELDRLDATTRRFLAKLSSDQPSDRADRREAFRLQIELLPESDPARRIVEAHDPTVVFDREHKRLVTERTLAQWRDALVFLTARFNVPGPDSDFIETERRVIKVQYASLPDAMQDAVAHVERNYPVSVYLLEHPADPAKLEAAIRASRSEALDRKHLAMNAAELMSKLYAADIHRLIMQGLLTGSAANYNMLYHRGYTSGIYR